MRTARALAGGACAILLTAMSCGGGSGAGTGGVGFSCGWGIEGDTDPAPTFIKLRDRYFVRTLQLNPVTSTYLGGDGYSEELRDTNGRLRDYSQDALTKEIGFYRNIQEALQRIDISRLPRHLVVDDKLMDAQIKFLLHELTDRKYYRRALDTYVAEPFRGLDWQLQGMQDLGAGRRGTEEEWRLVVSRVDAIPHYVDVARSNLLLGKQAGDLPDRRMVEFDGIQASRSNAEYFRKSLPATAAASIGSSPFGPTLLARLSQSAEHAAAAWDDFGKFLATTYDLKENIDRYAAGTEEYEWRVHNALGDPRTAAELFEYGAQQVALYDARLKQLAYEIDPQAQTVLGVARKLSDDAPRSDEEMYAWYREAATRAVAYGREHNLFDMPSDYKLDIVPTPQILVGTIDASYYPAPPFKRAGVGRFYLSPTNNNLGTLRVQHNRAAIADTTIHEGFPGHDWHFKFMTQRGPAISNIRWLTPGAVEDSSAMWSDSMAAEGWGLYAEELMAEPGAGRPYGFYTAPEYLYELQGQMMRAVRVRVDVGIHTGRMTFEQARDYFAEHVHFYPGACTATDADARATCEIATRAIYRYSKWPTQAITYNLGKNAIVDLRETFKGRKGSAYSPKAFHEKLMGMGTIPVHYFRDTFLAQ
jgi:uncharacterized protein (DUF885 family)